MSRIGGSSDRPDQTTLYPRISGSFKDWNRLPGTDDFDIVENKVELAIHFTDSVEDLEVSYGDDQIDDAKELLAEVDSSDDSLAEAIEDSDELVASFPPLGEELLALKDPKLLIEHNATDEDTGFQGFFDGDPWNELIIAGPGGERILSVNPEGGLFDFGLTELFFETSEPENDEVPIENVLARLDEGEYTATGDIVGANESSIATPFTHAIPAGPELLTPEEDAEEVDPSSVLFPGIP